MTLHVVKQAAGSESGLPAPPISLHQQILTRFMELFEADERVSQQAKFGFSSLVADERMLHRATIQQVVLASIGAQGGSAQES